MEANEMDQEYKLTESELTTIKHLIVDFDVNHTCSKWIVEPSEHAIKTGMISGRKIYNSHSHSRCCNHLQCTEKSESAAYEITAIFREAKNRHINSVFPGGPSAAVAVAKVDVSAEVEEPRKYTSGGAEKFFTFCEKNEPKKLLLK